MTEADKWQALDGFAFGDGFRISLHRYSNGRPAARVWHDIEGPWCSLTHNLPDEPLGPGEFHVRCEDLEHAGVVFKTLRALGKIEPTGKAASAGRGGALRGSLAAPMIERRRRFT